MGSSGGVEALHQLKSIEPPSWLTPSPDLSQTTRIASQHLFSSLRPFCPKSHLDTLLIQGFDAEQIWQQIDLLTDPLISNLRREVNRFEKNPELVSKLFGGSGGAKFVKKKAKPVLEDSEEDVVEGFDDIVDEEDDEEEEEEEKGGIEDRFLKMNELQDYMHKDEEREYGGAKEKEEDDEDDEEDEDDEMDGLEDDSDEDGLATYEDFFGGKKKNVSKSKPKPRNDSEDDDDEVTYEDYFGGKKEEDSKRKLKHRDDSEEEDDEEDDEEELIGSEKKQVSKKEMESGDESEDGEQDDAERTASLSTHEKQLLKQRSVIEQMEKENLGQKAWPLQGEVTASKRPKNSALGVDLDFERNVRPVPVITEEIKASLEEIIKKRIIENRFDDVQWASNLATRAPKETKELDENKSSRGLAEIYEEEYVQQIGGTGPVSSADGLKKEAQILFQKLCLKLDALSHFHFKPKPIIEDMSIPTNVPALAMEEIAPVAVSDAAMLAPEEVFEGKGDIKEEAELTQAERKRRRAKKKSKKRKLEAEKADKVGKKTRANDLVNQSNGKEEL